MTREKYSIKLQDFTPFIGSFIYGERNWKDENGKLKMPQPYEEYSMTGLGLLVLNFSTGILCGLGIFKGLEAILK